MAAAWHLANAWVESAEVQDDDGRIPLHLAVSATMWAGNSTFDMVHYLAYVAPSTLGVQDNEGRLPLHAAMEQVNEITTAEANELLDCVRLLVVRHPEAM